MAWLVDRSERMATGGPNRHAPMELELWRMALRAELRRIRLTLPQIGCVADVLNGTMMLTPGMALNVPIVYANVSDAFMLAREYGEISSYGNKWGIDEEELKTYLLRLGPTADHALHDAVSRWWDGEHEHSVVGWTAVGLPVADPQDRNTH
jgi:hypothetical protein